MIKKQLLVWASLFALSFVQIQAQNQEEYPFIKEKAYTKGQIKYGSYQRSSQYVEMSDGVKLAVDILEPTLGPKRERSPVIFIFTPYGRSYMVPGIKFPARLATAVAGLGWGPEYDMGSYYDGVKLLLENGYRIVVADMRGTGASYGYQMPLEPKLGLDGKEMVDWIANQPWCNGKVGMMGASFLAWAQFMTAAQKPEALKCIFPEVMGFDVYSTGVRPGGIPAKRWMIGFSDRLQGFNLGVKEVNKGLLPTLPVVDSDGDGKLVDEWPGINREEVLKGYFLPTYKDRKAGKANPYYDALMEHVDNFLGVQLLDTGFQYYNSLGPAPFDEISYEYTSPGYYAQQIAESRVAIYNAGGWFDGFVKGTPMWYASMAPSNPSRLMMAPRFHIPTVPNYYKKFTDYPGDYKEELRVEQLRFFDYHLKGIDRGFSKDSTVKVFAMHGGWISSNSWPITGTTFEPLFLQSNNTLSQKLRKKGSIPYEVDFEVSSNYGKNNGNRWLMYRAGSGKVMNRQILDDKCLLFEGPKLAEDLWVVGHPMIQLFVSSDQAYGDVFVYLEEVDEDGNAFYVTEGQLRGGWAESHNYDEVAGNNWDVKPDFLPWKGFRKEQWQDSIFAKNKVVEMSFDLLPTAYKFRKGNKLRIAIAGADAGNFELNPGLCPGDESGNCLSTTYRIICTDKFSSKIELPILRRK